MFQTLQQIDPATLTIPYFYLLYSLADNLYSSRSSAKNVHQALLPEGQAWPQITNGLLQFDPIQIRYVGRELSRIVEIVFIGAEQTQNFIPAVQLLQNVILRLDPASSTLSLTHYYYIRSCLYARAYQDAVEILDRSVYHLPTPESTKTLDKRLAKNLCSTGESSITYINSQTGLSGKLTSRIYLEYCLLAAICYTGVARYRSARAFLENVLVTPTQQNVASNIMVEAYKKWLLLSLIIDGDSRQPPRAVSGNALKHLRNLAKTYECVVDAFKANNIQVLHAEVQEGQEIWENDCNIGLIAEVVASHTKFKVTRLAKVFAALPVEEVARRASPTPDDAQGFLAYLHKLIATGQLQAQITSSQSGLGTVRFLQGVKSSTSEAQIQQLLQQKSRELHVLLRNISNYDHQLEVNKDYIEWLTKAKKARDQEKKTNGAGKPATADVDEDMMVDY